MLQDSATPEYVDHHLQTLNSGKLEVGSERAAHTVEAVQVFEPAAASVEQEVVVAGEPSAVESVELELLAVVV